MTKIVVEDRVKWIWQRQGQVDMTKMVGEDRVKWIWQKWSLKTGSQKKSLIVF